MLGQFLVFACRVLGVGWGGLWVWGKRQRIAFLWGWVLGCFGGSISIDFSVLMLLVCSVPVLFQ